MSLQKKTPIFKAPRNFNLSGEISPLKWSEYFESQGDIEIPSGSLHFYRKGFEGPLIVCLHGGGYSGLTWALFSKEITKLMVCQVLVLDLRGHGKSKTASEDDFSLNSFAQDIVSAIKELYPKGHPAITLVGHSLGGSIAVEVCRLYDNISALVVIDIVEGTAMSALSSMQTVLQSRPSRFATVEDAIRWCYRSGMTHNVEAARVSIPGQIKNMFTGVLATDEIDKNQPSSNVQKKPIDKDYGCCTIVEEKEYELEEEKRSISQKDLKKAFDKTDTLSKPPVTKVAKKYGWKVDLGTTEKFWTGWFEGLSKHFLELRQPKLLLLANINGLDTALTVGQMQGKFMLNVLSKAGHALQEDQPDKVAEAIAVFLSKQGIAMPKEKLPGTVPIC